MALGATSLNPDNVLIGTSKGPGIWIAPAGTAEPATADVAPAAPWVTLGYLSEDGVKWSTKTDSQSIMAWQSKAALRSFITKREVMAEFSMLEVSKQNFQLYFGQKVDFPPTDTGDFNIEVRSDAPSYTYALLLDLQDGDVVTRMYFPRASLSDAGDMEITQSGAIALPVTMAAQDDNGVLVNVTRATITNARQARAESPKVASA